MSKTALVVDDSPTMRQMVAFTLTNAGFTVVEAEHGRDAVNKVTGGPKMDIVVTDLNMPEMHGIEVLQFVRAHKTYRDLPVVVLTTRGDQGSREEAAASGATDYLTKPFQAGELLVHARKLLAEE